jgi:hypothetical protein
MLMRAGAAEAARAVSHRSFLGGSLCKMVNRYKTKDADHEVHNNSCDHPKEALAWAAFRPAGSRPWN